MLPAPSLYNVADYTCRVT